MKTDPLGQNNLGDIRYNEDVLKTMISMALSEVEGVYGMESRSSGNILSRKSISHINKISIEGKNATIDLSIVVAYGLLLRDVAKNVQNKVIEVIETMTDLNVDAVNVTVAGLDIKD
ncbi:Asp23/Gls24 family envelope stress response protein [Desulfoscipio sp. XC116]|uniref:Asp23/Gls24 family envelope stress response protein n=1 Tax=Desulfoscipio sp. XC116 TaxID=3144975 RepID=UPI00325C2165